MLPNNNPQNKDDLQQEIAELQTQGLAAIEKAKQAMTPEVYKAFTKEIFPDCGSSDTLDELFKRWTTVDPDDFNIPALCKIIEIQVKDVKKIVEKLCDSEKIQAEAKQVEPTSAKKTTGLGLFDAAKQPTVQVNHSEKTPAEIKKEQATREIIAGITQKKSAPVYRPSSRVNISFVADMTGAPDSPVLGRSNVKLEPSNVADLADAPDSPVLGRTNVKVDPSKFSL